MAQPQMPTHIDVDGVTVRVRLQSKLGRQAGGYGVPADYDKNVIRIDPHTTRRSVAQSLVGELMHHLWERAGLDTYYTSRQTEHIIHELDHWLHEVLRKNPQLVRFLSTS